LISESIIGINLLNVQSFRIVQFFDAINTKFYFYDPNFLLYDKEICINMKFKDYKIEEPIIFVILGNLTIDDIIISLLNNYFMIGVTSKPIMADGKSMSPFHFMKHDIAHSQIIMQRNKSIKDIKLIYENIKTFYYSLKQLVVQDVFYNVSLILFLYYMK